MYEKNKRQVMSMRELYTACDQILDATLGFYELKGPEDTEGTKLSYDWLSLAHGVLKDDLRDDATERQALIALVSPEMIPQLYSDWMEWMRGEQTTVDGEVARDFQATS